jgi:hypothetical protein
MAPNLQAPSLPILRRHCGVAFRHPAGQNDHVGYVQSGTITVSIGGNEVTLVVRDAYRIRAGHDAWVVADVAPR